MKRFLLPTTVLLALMALGIGPGDEVVTTPLTMTATASSILMQNAIPVFADVEDTTFNLDPKAVKSVIGPRTKAILTVDLYGQPSDLDALRQIADNVDAPLIEDNSQALGTRYKDRWTGTVGQMGVLSFNYHKPIQTGEGGAVLTDDEELAFRLKLIRNHGEACVEGFGREDVQAQLGWNYRMDELAAAVGIAQLEKLDFLTEWRMRLGEALTDKFKGHPFIESPAVREGCTTNYYVYAMKFNPVEAGVSRDTFVEALKAEGIWVNAGYIPPLYRQPMYQKRWAYGARGCPFTCGHAEVDPTELYRDGICPVAERLHDEILITTSMVKYPHTEREICELAEAIEKVSSGIEWLKEWEQEARE